MALPPNTYRVNFTVGKDNFSFPFFYGKLDAITVQNLLPTDTSFENEDALWTRKMELHFKSINLLRTVANSDIQIHYVARRVICAFDCALHVAIMGSYNMEIPKRADEAKRLKQMSREELTDQCKKLTLNDNELTQKNQQLTRKNKDLEVKIKEEVEKYDDLNKKYQKMLLMFGRGVDKRVE